MEANKRRWRGGRALYAARGGGKVLRGGESSGGELAGVGKQGRRLRRDVEEEKCDNAGFRG